MKKIKPKKLYTKKFFKECGKTGGRKAKKAQTASQVWNFTSPIIEPKLKDQFGNNLITG